MELLDRFYPDAYFESAYVIEYKKLYDEGYRGIIFDIDNTLVPHGAPSDERSRKLLKGLMEMGYGVTLLSNNKPKRVDMFNEPIGALCVYKAGKPSRKGYRKAMEKMGTDERNTFFVGDQLFTDVWGAKRTGIKSFLVKPIDKKEEIQIVIKRVLEKIVLRGYLKKNRVSASNN